MAAPGELRTLLTVGILLLLSPTSQIKEVQIQKTGNNNSDTDNVVVATTSIQTIKTLKIYKLDFYYGDQDKLRERLYQI